MTAVFISFTEFENFVKNKKKTDKMHCFVPRATWIVFAAK